MKTKVVYNACYGGYSFSKVACEALAAMGVEEAARHLEEVKGDNLLDGKWFGFRPELPRHAWVLKRLAEGKVLYRPRHAAGSIMFSETLIRWERVDGIIEFCVPGEMVWSSKRGQLCFDGKMLCRIARPSEVPQ